MTGRDNRIYQEAAALWREVYGAPPPEGADGGVMLDMITRGLPAEDYARLNSPFLRPTDIVFPKREGV